MEFLIDAFREVHGLVSMSKKWESSRLWSHYADKHKGLCFGLDINDDDNIWSVTYKPRVETLDCGDLLKEIRDLQRVPGYKIPPPDLTQLNRSTQKASCGT